MYAALIKNEARLEARPLAAYLGIALALFGTGSLSVLLRLPVVSGFGFVIAIAASILLTIGIPLHLLVRYYVSMYGRQGYLTHAIPAKHTVLYAAKFTWALVIWLGAILVALGLGLLTFIAQAVAAGGGAADVWRALDEAFAAAPAARGVMGVWLVIVLFANVAQFGWVVSFGMEERFRSLGIGGPVLMWFASYTALQVLSILAIVLIPIGVTSDLSQLVFASFIPELATAFTGGEPSFIPLGWLVVLPLGLPVFVLWTLRSLRDHTSLR